MVSTAFWIPRARYQAHNNKLIQLQKRERNAFLSRSIEINVGNTVGNQGRAAEIEIHRLCVSKYVESKEQFCKLVATKRQTRVSKIILNISVSDFPTCLRRHKYLDFLSQITMIWTTCSGLFIEFQKMKIPKLLCSVKANNAE